MKKFSFAVVVLCFIFSLAGCKSTPSGPSNPAPNIPIINNFSASPDTIELGSSSTISWIVSNAQNIEIDQGIGTVNSSGSTSVSPSETITYTLIASNGNGSATKSCTITVNQPPVINNFSAVPNFIILESSSTLSWNVSNAQEVTIDQGIGQVSASGSISITPNNTITYTLTAKNGSLTATESCVVTVDWRGFVCYITDTGTKYHRGSCQYLSQSKIATTLGEACAQGYSPCSVCDPPSCR